MCFKHCETVWEHGRIILHLSVRLQGLYKAFFCLPCSLHAPPWPLSVIISAILTIRAPVCVPFCPSWDWSSFSCSCLTRMPHTHKLMLQCRSNSSDEVHYLLHALTCCITLRMLTACLWSPRNEAGLIAAVQRTCVCVCMCGFVCVWRSSCTRVLFGDFLWGSVAIWWLLSVLHMYLVGLAPQCPSLIYALGTC